VNAEKDAHAKEPYTYAKDPCISAKEPCISAKVIYLDAIKNGSRNDQNADSCVNGARHIRKRALRVCKRALYKYKRAMHICKLMA